MTPRGLEELIGRLLDEFYAQRIAKLSGLKLRDTLKRKTPYLFRAVRSRTASEAVNRFTGEFIQRYCDARGVINWRALVELNSGKANG